MTQDINISNWELNDSIDDSLMQTEYEKLFNKVNKLREEYAKRAEKII